MKFEIRFLTLGALLGFVAGAVPSCGPAKACGPDTCSTCCNAAGECVAAAGSATCGTKGSTCVDCTASSQVCTAAFVCGAANGGSDAGSDAGAPCDATSCAGGCCDGTGACIAATPVMQSAQRCGTAGQACAACPAGNSCMSGVCKAPPDGGQSVGVGATCASQSDCAAVGDGGVCRLTTEAGNGRYEGGYCTAECRTRADCGAGNECAQLGLAFGELSLLCVNKCVVSASTCRPGYRCYPFISANDGVCFLDSQHLPAPGSIDAGPPADKVGNGCMEASQCSGPPNPPFSKLAYCIVESDDAGMTGWPGGYCSVQCHERPSICGPNAACLGTSDFATCFSLCDGANQGQGSCRADYRCALIANSSDAGVCRPSCLAPGAGCAQGKTCDDGGYCR